MRASAERALLLFAALAPLWSAPAAEEAGVRVALRWTRVAEAVAYQLEIARDPLFREVVLRERVELNGFRWTTLPRTTFHWRVRSVDASGRLGDWSEPRTIEPYPPPGVDSRLAATLPAPRPLSPPPNAQVAWSDPPPRVSVSWSRVEGATGYQLQLGLEDGEEQRVSTARSAHAFTAPGAGTWVWRVRALRGEASGDWSETRRLFVGLQAPQLLFPGAGERLTTRGPMGQLEVRWEPVPGASAYLVQLARDADFASLASAQRVGDAAPCLLTGVPAGKYFLRVAAEGMDGKVASSSGVMPLELVQLPPLAAPALRGPEEESVAPPGAALSFRWTPVPEAAGYELLIEPLAGAEPPQTAQSSSAELQAVPTGQGERVWRVRALDSASNPGLWSERRRLFVGLPTTQRAEVELGQSSLRADGHSSTALHIRLLDARGRPVRGARPALSASAGTISEPTETSGGYLATYTSPEEPPSHGEAMIRIRDRALETTTQLKLIPRDGRLRVGAQLGWNANFGVLSSPYLGLAVDGRLPLLGYRLGLGLRAGGYFGGRQLQSPSGPLQTGAWVGRAALLISYDHRLPWGTLYGAAGPSLQAVRVDLGELVTGGWVPGVQVLVGGLRRWGPGVATLEVSYSLADFRSADVSLRAGGLTATVGYKVALL